MTSVVLTEKSYGIDAAGFVHLASFTNAKAAGYEFASLYVGGNFGVDKATVERVWAAQMAVQLNFERNANDALQGAQLGISHANAALNEASALGWLGESPVVFSGTDFGVATSQFAACDAYYQAVVNVFAGKPCGAYGPPSYLRHLATQSWLPFDFVLWQWAGAGAAEWWTSAKQIFVPTHDVSHIGCSVDENVTLRQYPFWSGYGVAPVEPDPLPTLEADMSLVFIKNAAGVVKAVDEDGYGRAINGAEFYGARKQSLDNAVLADDVTFDTWPVRPLAAPSGPVTVNVDYPALAKAIFDEQARRLSA